MTSGVDPQLAERLAQTNANVRAHAEEIGDRVRAKSQEIIEEQERAREAAERHSAELDRQVEEKKEAAKNQWNARAEQDHTMRFGDEEEETYAPPPPQPAPYGLPEPPAPAAAPPSEARRGRHARRPIEDEDDFSTTNWLD
ncbi:hypothetical protein [Amycolatopsis sp. NPDC059657]|uniref:hypothetical protein n=1 Tax=Amycolatopsis sp. NPDC059657 TaxID=3346899 RepID=UPI00366BE02E